MSNMPNRSLLLVTLAMLMACSAEPNAAQPPAKGDNVDSAHPLQAPSATSAKSPAEVAAPAAPAPATVLEAIFQDPGDRSSSYAVENGTLATFWFGQRYEVSGAAYYTGFVEQTPDHFDGSTGDPPSAKATLTQATFVAPGRSATWQFVGAQRFVGEVGTRGQADAPDPSRPALLRQIGSDRLLLGVPTNAAIEQGVVQKNYEFLLRGADGAWSHVGTINAGQDDSAGCDGGRVFPCAPASGRITFEQGGGDMPAITVRLEPGSSDRSSARTVTYRFDAVTSTYHAP